MVAAALQCVRARTTVCTTGILLVTSWPPICRRAAMQFLVRSPLSPDECNRRLTTSIEGPTGSMKLTVHGWHILGQIKSGELQATVIGIAITPDGKRTLASRPNLSAHLTQADTGTVIAGEITPRLQQTRRQAFVGKYLLPPVLLLAAIVAIVVPADRVLMIGVIAVCLLMLLGARVSRGSLGRNEEASLRYLLGWLGHTVEGTIDAGVNP
jgi:hypothetical protein